MVGPDASPALTCALPLLRPRRQFLRHGEPRQVLSEWVEMPAQSKCLLGEVAPSGPAHRSWCSTIILTRQPAEHPSGLRGSVHAGQARHFPAASPVEAQRQPFLLCGAEVGLRAAAPSLHTAQQIACLTRH